MTAHKDDQYQFEDDLNIFIYCYTVLNVDITIAKFYKSFNDRQINFSKLKNHFDK